MDEETGVEEAEKAEGETGDEKPTSENEGSADGRENGDKGAASAAETPKYTEKQLQDILHKRTKEYSAKLEPWGKFGTPETLEQKLTRLQELEAKVSSTPASSAAPAARTPEQEAFREYLLKEFPELARVPKLEEQIGKFGQQDQQKWDAFVETGRSRVSELVKKELSIEDPKAAAHIENMVAAAIQNDVTKDAYGKQVPGPLLRAFLRGDVGAVEQAFNEVKGLFKGVEKGLAAKYSQAKAKTGELPRPPEGGGLPAPAAKAKPKSDEERSTAAFARLQELAAGGGARG